MKSEVNFMSDHFDKRRKLNMIKPGIVMLGINFVLTVCGAIANLLNWNTVSIITYALSALLMLALIINASILILAASALAAPVPAATSSNFTPGPICVSANASAANSPVNGSDCAA